MNNIKVLESLSKNEAREIWGKLKYDNSYFANINCIHKKPIKRDEPVYRSSKIYELYLVSLYSGSKMFDNFNEFIMQLNSLNLISKWSIKTIQNIIDENEISSGDFYTSFKDDSIIRDIKNGYWNKQTDQIVFDKNYSSEITDDNFYITFNGNSIKNISKNKNIYTIQSYSSENISAKIIMKNDGFYMIQTNYGNFYFNKEISVPLKNSKSVIVRQNEAVFENVFEIKKFYEYEDINNNAEKNIILDSFPLLENSNNILIELEGENISRAKIFYRLFSNRWNDWVEYEKQIILDNYIVEKKEGVLRPFMNNKNIGKIDIDLSGYTNDSTLLVDRIQSILLREVDSGPSSWEQGLYWKTNIYLEQTTEFNVGNNEVIIDEEYRSGLIKLTQGIHSIRIPSSYAYPVTYASEDRYKPYNLYHIFSGGAGYEKKGYIFKRKSSLKTIPEILYTNSSGHNFIYKDSEYHLCVDSEIDKLNIEKSLAIIKYRGNNNYEYIQIKLVLPEDFIGTVDSMRIIFK